MGKQLIRIGMLGMGTVGSGVAELINTNCNDIAEKTGFEIRIDKVLVRDPGRQRSVKLGRDQFTTDASAVLENPELDLIIELIGGLEPARTYVLAALKNGKHVITANKDLLASHGPELFVAAAENNRNLFYEGSVGGGIPLIRPLKYSLSADCIQRIVGIVNGTTNYIFTRMDRDNLSLPDALAEAQKLGFAEANPTNDLDGLDAVYKLVIMASLAFGEFVNPDDIYVQGIKEVTHEDIAYARELGYAVKLLAIGEHVSDGLALRVHPTLVPLSHPLSSVQNEFNAVFIEAAAAGDLMFYGRGAGAKPTASAVLADVIEAARSVSSGLSVDVVVHTKREKRVVPVYELNSRFYLRFLAEDRPGVFAALANVFGDEQVSLDLVIQKRRVGNLAEIVLITHDVREESFRKALNKVMEIPAIQPESSMIRLLG
ncbi:MAG: homoserine dehydrogenase [Bacillota bacterium]|nr:homoserine dehydrogenase [Bacillota bacterium]